jgi:hypothetical protein
MISLSWRDQDVIYDPTAADVVDEDTQPKLEVAQVSRYGQLQTHYVYDSSAFCRQW